MRKIVRIFGVKIHLPAVRKNIIVNNNIVNIEKHGVAKNCSIIIENGTIESLDVVSPHSNTGVYIHSGHMISKNVFIQNTDSHPIYELSDATHPINRATKIVDIAPHCWLGMNVTVMKDVSLPENTIVGYEAVVTKSFTQPNTVIAGISAKIIKENVKWNAKTDEFFI